MVLGILKKALVGVVLLVVILGTSVNHLYINTSTSLFSTQQTYERPSSLQMTTNEDKTPAVTGQPKVFIVSMPRSGSTFMLEIFRNHPDFLGLFESTKWMRRHPRGCDVNYFLDKSETSPEAQWFRDIYTCQFENYKKRLGEWGETKSGNKSECVAGNPPSKVVVTKEIWPWGLRLGWLDRIVGQDLRVISLTRDVRGFVSSYIYVPTYTVTVIPSVPPGSQIDPNSFPPELKPYNVTKWKNTLYQSWRMDRVDLWTHFCLEGIEVPNFLRTRMPFLKRVMLDKYAAPHLRMASVWTIMTAVTQLKLERHLKGRYFSVSHTELSLNPHPIVNEMFSFLGRSPAPASVHNFVEEHTREGNYTSRHSTTRNSTEAAVIYLSRLKEKQIADIEAIAEGVMEPLGFVPISKKLSKLDPEDYERISRGKGNPPPPLPVFEWQKETKEDEKDNTFSESDSSEDSEEEEVTEDKGERKAKGEAEAFTEVMGEIKEQMLEEIQEELTKG